MNDKVNKDGKESSEAEGLKRLNDKIKELKKRNITPPVDNEEPTGLLSGGPEHLDLEDESEKT
jgi:hypothetical protein